MKRILDVTLAIEVVVALLWTAAWASETGSSGIAVLGWFALMAAVFAVAFVIGAIAAWRAPALRRRATLVMALPWIGGFAPVLLRTVAGGPLAADHVRNLLAACLGGVLLLALLFPRHGVRCLPQALFRSRGWNLLVLAALGLGWVALLALVGWAFTQHGQASFATLARTGSGSGAALAVLAASSFVLVLGAWSVLAAAWGWLGLHGGVDGAPRRLHRYQLIGALPGILLSAAIWIWLSVQR